MSRFKIEEGPLEGLVIIRMIDISTEEEDCQTYNKNELKQLGFNVDFVQENQSISRAGVLRGVHLQKQYPQGKLIRVARGKIYDVAVDLRKNSNTYKQWYGIELSADNKTQLYIPGGFAHGFLTLEEDTIVIFKVTDYFHPSDEVGFIWNDPDIQIDWPVVKNESMLDTVYSTLNGTPIILGTKDMTLPFAKEVFNI